MTLLLIVGSIVLIKDEKKTTGLIPQQSQQVESRALYIAQTALDRSIKALVTNPKWRAGFDGVPFESGTYNVRIFDASADAARSPADNIPPNYVRIIATAEIDGVTKEVEAVWVNALSAFDYIYSAGNELELGHDNGTHVAVIGAIHNNSWQGGALTVHAGTTVYGDVSSVGDVEVGADAVESSALVYGSVWGAQINIGKTSEIRKYENLSELVEQIDLNGDGDERDIGLSKEPIRVSGASAVVSAGRAVSNGATDSRVGGGMLQVIVGEPGVGPIVDPRPDFTVYYELVTGMSRYPPHLDHVSTPIIGDGDGHYFASSSAFLDWLRFKNPRGVVCWRCNGDGYIDSEQTSPCTTCNGRGSDSAVEVTGVFYIDDATLDLGSFGQNLVVHGTIVVAQGDPYQWPEKEVYVPGDAAAIPHFPQKGRFLLTGKNRMHFTQTYRSQEEGGSYAWSERAVFSGEDRQVVPIRAPGRAMRGFPATIAPEAIVIEPRQAGFAYQPGDIGDEKLTVLQGVVYGEQVVRFHGRGGWSGETLVFEEELDREPDEALDESVLNIDLNGDHDIFDRVELSDISAVPVIAVARDRYNVDINNDGILNDVTIGVDYQKFFAERGHRYPILIYHEGLVLSQKIHSCDQVLVSHDAQVSAGGIPFGFEVSFGSTTYQGLVSWWENRSP